MEWAFEVLGNPRTIEQAWELIRPGGTVVVVGLSPKGSKVTLPAFDFISEKNIRGCFYGSSRFHADIPVILERIKTGRMRIEGMVSHTVPLEELEIHLREEIERQLKSELSEQEIFDSAVQKIGSAHTIQYEFEKVEKAAEDRQWKEGQIWLGAILGLLQLIVIGSVLFNSDMRFGQRMSGLALRRFAR